MNEIIQIIVQGRVQGVGFRQFTQDTARRMGIAGWVRNLPDGRVEVLARVTEEIKPKFLAALRQGPTLSQVDHLSVNAPSEDRPCPERGFAIRH